MGLLIIGILLFTGSHLLLSVAPGQVKKARLRIGNGGVKGLLTLLSIAGLAFIVFGWRSSETTWLYNTAPSLRSIALLMLLLAIILLVVSNRPSILKQRLRHPQLTGVLLWAIAHLMLNGDSRSVLLFTAIACWALLEIVLINRREGPWTKPAAASPGAEILTLILALLVTAALIWLHPWLAGVPVIHSP